MFSLLGYDPPRRSWSDGLRRLYATWLVWATLDPLTREYEAERFGRGLALGVALSLALWTTLFAIWRLS